MCACMWYVVTSVMMCMHLMFIDEAGEVLRLSVRQKTGPQHRASARKLHTVRGVCHVF